MKYFVTGATGFIGRHLVQQLVGAGHTVVTLVRNPQEAGWLADLGVALARGDITDKESLQAGMTGVDGVFHLAGLYKLGFKNKALMRQVNVEGTRNVLETMRDLGIAKGVYTSTLAVFSDTRGQMVDETYHYSGPHLSEYDRTKWQAHYEVAEPLMHAGLPLVIVMPGAVYGPGDTSAVGEAFEQYLHKRLPVLPKGAVLCWAHVEDVARGHILAMERGKSGESYIIAGPARSFEDVFALAERITGIPAPRLRLTPGVMKALAALMGVVGAVVPLPAAYSAEGLRVTAGVTYLGSNEKAQRELGYTVRPLEEGLRETLETMMNR
jgi:nucleoside-diphosphate-sugar epimerase